MAVVPWRGPGVPPAPDGSDPRSRTGVPGRAFPRWHPFGRFTVTTANPALFTVSNARIHRPRCWQCGRWLPRQGVSLIVWGLTRDEWIQQGRWHIQPDQGHPWCHTCAHTWWGLDLRQEPVPPAGGTYLGIPLTRACWSEREDGHGLAHYWRQRLSPPARRSEAFSE